MVNIGIEKHQALVYEGSGTHGRGVWPSPVITSAKFAYPSEGNLTAHSSSDRFGYRFREDSFDPVSRIRRGRFYLGEGSQPQSWRVSRHPGNPLDSIAPDIHGFRKELETFYASPIWHKYVKDSKELPVVLLGEDDCYTVWNIVSVESISTGENLVTLKARSSFGILPHIYEDKIPEAFLVKFKSALGHFTDEVHRSSPTSVIDRARDVATLALLAYFDLRKESAKDLGKLIKMLEKDNLTIAVNSANIIARLHARAKPSEQERRELHQIREQDAELAVQCIGTILCEIGFAEWR